MRDWQDWHRNYDDQSSSLARRLDVVRRRVDQALSEPRDGPVRILSLCSGDGRDLLPVLARRTRLGLETVVLIEQDPVLAQAARQTAADLAVPGVTVITGDAADQDHISPVIPVDLLLLCGIFGNVSERDIRRTVAVTPTLLRDGGAVIWTRGSRKPDLRPAIRGWFAEAGLHENAFDSEPDGFGVGVATKPSGTPAAAPLPARLFRFIR